MIIKSKAGTEIAKNGYTVIDELNQIPMIKTNYLQLEHNHINPIIIGSKAFEHKDIFINVVEDTETSGDTAFKEYNAIHEFAWILSGMRKHDSYTGYLSLEQYLNMVLKDTDFTYQVEGGHQYYALQFENLGDGESHLDMFFKMLNRWNTEFELRGKKVYITHQRGRLRDKHVGRYKMNIIDTIINSDITDGATAVWGYFGKKNEENPENSTYREFYWQIDELVEQYGIRYAKPYSNENITQEETMIEYLNNIILDSWKISTEVDIAEITDEVVQTGDEYVAVDERLGITLNTRIQKLESVYDADDKLLYQTATLGTVSFASAASGSSSQLQEVIEKVKKDYNDRITDLKQEFDNRFNDEVTQIEIDFNELVNGVRQEIKADQERMENEMSQMKLDQQQRVSEIYEDIGSINQTVSDVANKANYLDGLYTDLSTQTGEVSSTVANIIDGKAPAGSVLKQTIDGVVGRVWEQDIDSLNFENRNLLKKSNELYENSTYNIARYYFDADIKEGEEVTVSLKGQLGSDRTAFTLYNSGGYVFLVSLYPSNQKDGIYTATFKWRIQRDSTIAENKWLNVYQVANTGTTASKIEWIKLERGSKATPYTVAPEDLMKYTDIVARPDGFMLGSFELGGDKIAQAIVGKAGAIDLIADNVNLSNNLNVANQIKSLSLETVYANISELRTRMLVADVITANMVKFDTALIEKFTSSTAFINSLTAKSAFINNVKAIDITTSRIISEFGGDNTTIQGGRMTSTGKFDRTFDNGATASYISRVRSANGVFLISTIDKLDRFGNSMLNTDWTGRGLYYSEKAIGTQIDSFSRSSNRSGRYIDFYSSEVYTDGYTGSGMEVYSDTTLNLTTGYLSDINLNSDGSTWHNSRTSIYFRPDRRIEGDNTFRMYVYNGETLHDKDGILQYGSITSGQAVALRFSKSLSNPKVTVLNAQDYSLGVLRGRAVEVDEVRASNNYIFLAPSASGEVRVVRNYNLGQYSNIRASGFNGNFLQMNASHTGLHLYLRTYSGGEIKITQADTTDSYRDIRYRAAFEMSHEDYKTDIQEWKSSVLDVFRNHLKLNKFKVKDEVETEYARYHHGIVLRRDSNLDTFPVEWRHKDGYDSGEVMWWTVKGVQELAHENDTLKERINDLENKLNKIMEMIA